jgi:DNA processing protein
MTPVDPGERRARMLLSRVAEPGDPDVCRLVREFSAVELVDRLDRGHLTGSKARGWAERLADARASEPERAAERVGARFVCPGDQEWPVRLNDLEHLDDEASERRGGPPFGLWVRGARLRWTNVVAVVGARDSTPYGNHVASDIAGDCAVRGFVVVSGGAYGIDAAAHRAALACEGVSAAVLASGIDRPYPTGNRDLLDQLTTTGCLVSEAAPGCAPTKSRFLVRNRLIAALSQGTVVVEAALRSGALNTARWARDLGRGVMGVPGSVTAPTSAGVHELLRQPGSLLVTDAAEVIEHITPIGAALAPAKSGPVRPLDSLSARDRLLLDAVPRALGASAASIARVAGLARDVVDEALPRLALRGLVVHRHGGWRLADRPPDGEAR